MADAHHLLTESAFAARAAGRPIATLWSPNRGAAVALGMEDRWESPETADIASALEALWDSINLSIPHLMEVCRSAERDDANFAGLSGVLPVQYVALMRAIGTKGKVLENWLNLTKGQPRAIAGTPELSPVTGMSAAVGRYDSVYAALAVATKCDVEITNGAIPANTAEYAIAPATKLDHLFNVINRPLSSFAFKLWQRSGAPALGIGDKNVLVLAENEMVEESFLQLLFSGYRVGMLNIDFGSDFTVADTPESLLSALRTAWNTASKKALNENMSAACWLIAGPRIEKVLSRYPAVLQSARRWADNAIGIRRSENAVILSNGLYAPQQRIVDTIFREKGVRVVCTDHGIGVGLGRRHDTTAPFLASFSDKYLAHNTETVRVYSAAKSRPDQVFKAVGSQAVLTRTRCRLVQRAIYRRALGAKSTERLLMYVTSLCANNFHQGAGTSTDTQYQAFQSELLDSLGAYPGRTVVKPYPASRYHDPEPVWNSGPDHGLAIAPIGEFRQQRWAADVLLLDLCSSTLGWAMGTDIPIIYVDNISNPLADRARKPLSEALLLVDATKPDWQQTLEELLRLDRHELKQQWEQKRSARDEFYEEFGPGPNSRIGAKVREAVAAVFNESVSHHKTPAAANVSAMKASPRK